jgi:hypothetical protein
MIEGSAVDCSTCGAALPAGALFCGACGRSTRESAPVAVEAPEPERCVQCGAELAPTDIFCGECGFVRPSVSARRRPSDTRVLDPFPWGAGSAPRPVPSPPGSPVGEPAAVPTPAAEPTTAAEPVAVPAMLPSAPPMPPPLVTPPPAALRIPVLDVDEVDDTRLVDRTANGERFVLQFSTGESVSVTGTGLIGRNPLAEPGEYFDTFVAIVDPGRSVSKTHLEFGQEAGAFWVSDRWSGNGTVLREPDQQPRRCEPGKRYRVVRGSRIDIGEQFFIVS